MPAAQYIGAAAIAAQALGWALCRKHPAAALVAYAVALAGVVWMALHGLRSWWSAVAWLLAVLIIWQMTDTKARIQEAHVSSYPAAFLRPTGAAGTPAKRASLRR